MKNYVLPAVIGLLLALQGPARGTLVWESKDAVLHPSLSDKEAVAHFKYKNSGDKPVKITSVHASCGCTTAALAKDVVGPNESGEITATFTIGNRTGVQTKSITVLTDDQPEEPTVLKLTATIPQLLQITPSFIFWTPTDVLDPKTITIIPVGLFKIWQDWVVAIALGALLLFGILWMFFASGPVPKYEVTLIFAKGLPKETTQDHLKLVLKGKLDNEVFTVTDPYVETKRVDNIVTFKYVFDLPPWSPGYRYAVARGVSCWACP